MMGPRHCRHSDELQCHHQSSTNACIFKLPESIPGRRPAVRHSGLCLQSTKHSLHVTIGQLVSRLLVPQLNVFLCSCIDADIQQVIRTHCITLRCQSLASHLNSCLRGCCALARLPDPLIFTRTCSWKDFKRTLSGSLVGPDTPLKCVMIMNGMGFHLEHTLPCSSPAMYCDRTFHLRRKACNLDCPHTLLLVFKPMIPTSAMRVKQTQTEAICDRRTGIHLLVMLPVLGQEGCSHVQLDACLLQSFVQLAASAPLTFTIRDKR